MIFDQDMNYQNIYGYVQIGSAANGNRQTISLDNIPITHDGYLVAYLSNESNSAHYVYFDNFRVDHTTSRIKSSQDYYPFGLQFNSHTRTASTPQKYLYNGKELQEETNWYDYGARFYQPDLGRWFNVDPLASDAPDWTPYRYGFNNPIRFIDPNGMFEHVYEEQEDGSYQLVETNDSVIDEFRNRDGTVQYYNMETGVMSNKVNSDGEVVEETPQNSSPEFSVSESYASFSETPQGEAFEQTLSNVATVAGLVVAGPAVLAGEGTVVTVAGAAGVINGVDDLSTNFNENGNSLIQNQLGETNGSLLKMGMNIMGAIVGGSQSGFKFASKDAMDGAVNGVGAALDSKGVVDKTKDIFDK